MVQIDGLAQACQIPSHSLAGIGRSDSMPGLECFLISPRQITVGLCGDLCRDLLTGSLTRSDEVHTLSARQPAARLKWLGRRRNWFVEAAGYAAEGRKGGWNT